MLQYLELKGIKYGNNFCSFKHKFDKIAKATSN